MASPDLSGVNSHRLERDLLSLLSLTLLGGLALWKGSDPWLVAAVLGPIAGFSGFGTKAANSHDAQVRTELIRADKDKAVAGASGDLARQPPSSSSDLPRTP
jgi:hypothetical protein